MEYIALFAQRDAEFAEIVAQIVEGKIKNIRVDDSNAKAGGVMSKAVPRPKAEDNSEYMSSLNTQ